MKERERKKENLTRTWNIFAPPARFLWPCSVARWGARASWSTSCWVLNDIISDSMRWNKIEQVNDKGEKKNGNRMLRRFFALYISSHSHLLRHHGMGAKPLSNEWMDRCGGRAGPVMCMKLYIYIYIVKLEEWGTNCGLIGQIEWAQSTE